MKYSLYKNEILSKKNGADAAPFYMIITI